MNQQITIQKLRRFGITLGFFFPIFIGLLVPLLYGDSYKLWTLLPGFLLLILGLTKPNVLYYPYKFWIKLGAVLGWINSRLILGFIFIFIVQPISIFMKLFGYDPLRKNVTNVSSYREIKVNNKIDLTRIF